MHYVSPLPGWAPWVQGTFLVHLCIFRVQYCARHIIRAQYIFSKWMNEQINQHPVKCYLLSGFPWLSTMNTYVPLCFYDTLYTALQWDLQAVLSVSSTRLYCVLCSVTQSWPTLCDPMDCSPPGSSVHGDSPGKNTGVGCHALLSGDLPNPLGCEFLKDRMSSTFAYSQPDTWPCCDF